jgi:hypothetical protein
MSDNVVLEVSRSDTSAIRLVNVTSEPLTDGAVRLRVDRFAVTANTVTYAQVGDMLGYWDFFPTGDPGWGRVPAMGWADVVETNNPDVAVGGRYYGWFPMATHVDVTVAATSAGLRDDSAHRQAHAPVYRAFVDTRRDPLYPVADDADERGELEDRHALLRGLFQTGFLADAFFGARDWYGADTAVVLSASSKTAIAFAGCAAESGRRVVGVTSPAHTEFVGALGCYDDVVTYDDVASLPALDAVVVDMAGNGPALAALHDHLGEGLRYSMVVGRTHIEAPPAQVTSGPTPEMFFAPTAMSALAERGTDTAEVQARSATALASFVERSREWLDVERSSGPDAAAATWSEVHAGQVGPDVGRITSLLV